MKMLRNKMKLMAKSFGALVLKVKAKVYQYTGIYLANKEETNMLRSKWFWSKYSKIKQMQSKSKKSSRMSDKDIQSLIIGIWQAERRLYRYSSKFDYPSRYKYKFMFKPLAFVDKFIKTAKMDLRKLRK